MRTKNRLSAASSIRSPTAAAKAADCKTARAGTNWLAALSVVNTMKGPDSPPAKAASVAMRLAEISALGDMRS